MYPLCKKILLISCFVLNSHFAFSAEDGDVPDIPPEELAPLIDLVGGGEAIGSAQGKIIQNPDGTVTDTTGKLLNGTLLPAKGEGFVRSSKPETSWGTGMMISLLENSSELYVKTYQPKVKIYIGDIATEFGGKYSPHSSHQNGLDADILYMGNSRYDSVIDKDGTVNAKFDPQANWNYWRILVSQKILRNNKPETVVSMILVDPILKDFLILWAEAQGITQNPLDAEILKRLRPTANHDDHFHLRLKCSPHYLQCR